MKKIIKSGIAIGLSITTVNLIRKNRGKISKKGIFVVKKKQKWAQIKDYPQIISMDDF